MLFLAKKEIEKKKNYIYIYIMRLRHNGIDK